MRKSSKNLDFAYFFSNFVALTEKLKAMLGAIIGDIVGSRFEFGPAPEEGFDLFTDDCSFTDDTVCTIAVADAVLNGKSYKDALVEWCQRYPDPKGGYGARFYDWIFSDDHAPNNSCGNGSAMRVSSIGWLFDEWEDVVEEARKSAVVSHNHPEGIKGAECVAEVICWLRHMRFSKSDVERKVQKFYGYKLPPLSDIMRIGSEGHFDSTCQETVPAAIRCLVDSSTFEDAIRLAVLCDGDTDTKADITGAMAEACYGVPDEMVERAVSYLPADMRKILCQFYQHIQDEIG